MPEELDMAVEEPVESTVAESTEPAEPTEPSEPTEPAEPSEPSEGAATETPQTGKAEPLPADVQRALRTLRENPENVTIARTLQDAYYRNKAYSDAFPTVEDARLAKATLDAMGGPDGVAGMRRDTETLESIDSRIEEGDPTVIDDAFESYPEGSARLIERGLSLMEQRSPEAFNNLLRPIVVQSLLSSGIADRLNYAIEFLNGNQTEMASRQLAAVVSFVNKLAEEARAPVTPARAAPDTAKDEIAQQRIQLNVDRLAMQLGPYLQSTISRDIRGIAGERKLDSGAMNRLLQMVVTEIDGSVRDDAAYQANMNAYLRRGDVAGALSLAKASADRLRGQVVRSVWKELYGSSPATSPVQKTSAVPKSAKSAVPAPDTASEAPVRIARRPDGKFIDWDKTDQLLVIAGRAYLKDGRFVQWRVNEA